MLPAIDKGDYLVIHDTGAHGYAMGYNYNGKLKSAELLLKEDGSVELIRRSSLERSYYYQIMKGKRHPSRDKILRLCIGAGLTLRETTRALELSENAPLYPKSRRDIIITVAINQSATVIDTNLLLFEYGEKALE
jgi:transcriptional regulator with XRE-family HTH domain